MRVALWIAMVGAAIVACGGDAADAPDLTATVGAALPQCGLRASARTDGACEPVGPVAPDGATGFTWGADGWGLQATYATNCARDARAQLGETTCVPLDACAGSFPPEGAELVVSTKLHGANVVGDLQTALDRASPGATIAVDRGRWGSTSVRRDVTVVGRCARETVVGNGKNNAFFVNGADVTLRAMTLDSSASPIAVERGAVLAEGVAITGARVGVAAVGSESEVTLRRSLIVGDGRSSLGAMAARGGTFLIEETELRNLTAGVMVSDERSQGSLRRSIVSVVGDRQEDSAVAANARGHLEIEESVITRGAGSIAAVHRDAGTRGTSAKVSGSMRIRASVLEQLEAETTDTAAIAVDGGQLELVDVTLRHRAPIGVLAKGALTASRTVILGDTVVAPLRAGIMATGGSVVARALAIPWAQGVGVGVSEATLDLQGSLIANVAAREGSGNAVLVSRSTATIADCELADNEQAGIVSIGGSTVTASRAFVHGHLRRTDAAPGAGMFAFSTTAMLDGCVFEQNGEGIVAASSSLVVGATSFVGHDVALRAMHGMSVLDGSVEASPDTLAVGSDCRFSENRARTSFETLPEPPLDLPTPSRK